ncbi:MAG: terminase small subunit [Acidobacteria bacterium]|nr:terminase small subunit [Acidobacteriota bacterium]
MSQNPKSDCGAACRKLNSRQFKFHLAILEGDTQVEAHIAAGYKGKKERESAAGQVYRNLQVQAALAHHREKDAVKHAITKERVIEILAAQIEGSDPRIFGRVTDGVVEFENWDDIPGELTRGAGAIAETTTDAGGTVKVTIRDPVPAAARLAKMLGWDEPDRMTISWDDLEKRASAGDSEAIEELRRIASGG